MALNDNFDPPWSACLGGKKGSSDIARHIARGIGIAPCNTQKRARGSRKEFHDDGAVWPERY